MFRRLHDFFDSGRDGSALGVAQYHNQRRDELQCGKFDAAELRWSNDVSGNADDKKISQALVEDEFRRHPRVGTSEYYGEWVLARHQFAAARFGRAFVTVPNAGHEPAVAFSQAFERLLH
jgi:hypothetical protein